MAAVAPGVCRWSWLIAGLFGLAVVLAIGVIFSLALMRQTAELLDQPDQAHADLTRSALQYQADNLTKLWIGIVQAIGAVVLAIGGYFTWRNLRVTQQTLKATQDKLEIDREAQITNRFTQAIAHLGAELKDSKPNLEVRLGGIYALERIARDSPRDHWTIMEILTAYVRESAPWTERLPAAPDGVVSAPEDLPSGQPEELEEPPALRTDIQAILTVLGRRVQSDDRPEPARLDLHGTDLRRAELAGAYLERAALWDAHLERATLVNAHLEEAELWGAHLEEASLDEAHLEKAYLSGARLQRAHLSGAHLERAGLIGAYLQKASLINAHLQGAFLRGAHLEGSHLGGAHLEQVDNLTQDQVYSAASHGAGALLPPDWPADWRERFQKPAEQPPITPSAP